MLQSHIFIAGPSGSGKSTLAKTLAMLTGCRYLSLDNYWKGGPGLFVNAPLGGIVRSYEDPSLYDGAQLAANVAAHGAPCVAEGFCLLSYPEIQAVAGHRFYMEVPFDVCMDRRLARRPQRPSDASFWLIGEQETNRWVLPQKALPGVTILDATASPQEILSHLAPTPLNR